MIVIDGITYNAEWVLNTFQRTAEIVNGDESGRLQGNKDMQLEYVGTFFNFKGEIVRGKHCTDTEWDKLFMAVANPVNKHTVKIPFNQGVMTTTIYISTVSQILISQINGRNKWASTIEVTYTTMKSQWLAGKSIQGLS